mmetsp:Transcript_94858/g.263863  ORF Transcript_94858/g.263863 Transcript_94858/m.263863 type:complete len:236 (+) Transcript_94858:1356-2063(+)
MTRGQTFTAPTMAMSMKAMPMMGAQTVLKASKSPPRLKRTLNSTSDRMSSTKAAVMMACPKFSCSTPASPRSRRAIPTLVGAKAVPAEMPWGMKGFPKITIRTEPRIRGKMVPRTATAQAGSPTVLAFSKSKCMPLSKIIRATPAWPISVKTSGVKEQWWLMSASQLFWRHSVKESYLMPPLLPPESLRPASSSWPTPLWPPWPPGPLESSLWSSSLWPPWLSAPPATPWRSRAM